MRLRTIAASAALLAVAVLPIAAPGSAAEKQGDRCSITAKEFGRWSARVWDAERWSRGAPKKSTVRAQRAKLKCAKPATRAAIKDRWRADKSAFYAERTRCRSGDLFAGLFSTFSGGLTAGGYQATEPGIALRSSATLGRVFLVKHQGRSAYLRQTDWGPASWTGRTVDVTLAGAAKLGGVTTDAYGTARLVPEGCL